MTSAQIQRLTHRTRTFSVHAVATLVRTVLVPRALYGAQFWTQTDESLQQLNAAIVHPLKRALGLPRNSHTLSVLTECGVLDAERYAKLYAINHVQRSIRQPNSNPSTRAVATEIKRVIKNESKGHTNSKNRTALPSNVITTLAPYTDPSLPAAPLIRIDQWAELRDAHWGSSLRLALPTDHTPGQSTHLRYESLGDAQRRAALRFDTVSPWRQYKQKKRSNAQCDHCNRTEARALHLLDCPGIASRLRHHRFGRWFKPIKRKIERVSPTISRPNARAVFRTIVSGHHPLLSPDENSALRRESQLYLKALLALIKPRENSG